MIEKLSNEYRGGKQADNDFASIIANENLQTLNQNNFKEWKIIVKTYKISFLCVSTKLPSLKNNREQ